MRDYLNRLRAALADRYAIERELGAGGMGVVYLAKDLKHRRQVAVKVLKPGTTSSITGSRFLREIEITAGLTHPHILPVYDSGNADGFLFYVMPFVEGGSLRELLRSQTVPLDFALRTAQEVARALDYAHRRSIIHRDVKPENILVLDGHAMVADFGVARAISAAGGATFTESGIAIGSPPYMSPEQGLGIQGLDGRTDIYSLGCVLHEMLLGRVPETPFNRAEIRHLEKARRSLRHRQELDRLPANVTRVLARTLAERPADRYATARDLADALPCLSRGRVVRPRARHLVPVAAAALLTVFGGFVLGAPPRADQPPRGMPKLAVLPFENLGTDDQNPIVEGATDETTARLARVASVVVLSRQSTMRYRRSPKTVRQIGLELDADYLLEATVSWQSTPMGSPRLRVRPQLVRVQDGAHVWAGAFTENAEDVLEAQVSIAESVAVNVETALLRRDGALP